MDGWEAVRDLRADHRTSGIPIVLLTCSTREDLAERAEDARCDALSKPRRPPELVNDDCWNKAWMIEIAPSDEGELHKLLDPHAYAELLKTAAH